MSHQLDHIAIEGYKSIRKMDLDVRSINVLIGANGAGKSNFISAFGLLHDIVERRLQAHTAKHGGADSILHFGQKYTPSLRVRLDFGPNGYEVTLSPAAGDQLFFEDEKCWYKSGKHNRPFDVNLGSGMKESSLPNETERQRGRIARYVIDSLRSWKVYHFHDTSDSSRVKQKQPIDDNNTLRPDASNLAAFLYRLKQTERDAYRRIVASVSMVAPFFDDFTLRPDPVREDQIQLEWLEKGTDSYFNAHALSDGTLRFVCLSTLLMQPTPPTSILIDEPELGLHPYAIHQLAALIRSASQHSQVIVSTQSVTLMNQFEPDDVVVVDREGGESKFRRVIAEEVTAWTDDYALGDLWEKNIIGGRPA